MRQDEQRVGPTTSSLPKRMPVGEYGGIVPQALEKFRKEVQPASGYLPVQVLSGSFKENSTA